MNDFLHRGLAELADEVVPVDLHDRVSRAARTAHRRRQVAAGLAVGLAVLLLAVAVPLTLRGRSADPPIGPTVTPSPSASVTVAGIRLVYLRWPAAGGNTTELMAYDVGQPAPKPLRNIVNSAGTLSVSPDGRKMASVEVDGLYVSNIDGSGKRKLRSNIDGHCGRDWLPDSTELFASDLTTGLVMRINATTGAVKQLNFDIGTCSQVSNSLAISADATRIVHYSFPPRVVLATIDGVEIRSYDTSGAPRNFSPDGNLVVMEKMANQGYSVLDLRTGVETRIPTPGAGRLQWAYFTADGRILAEYGGGDIPREFVFYTAEGNQLGRMPVPATLDRAMFTGTFLTS